MTLARRLLIITLAAMMLLANANAEGNATESVAVSPFSVLAGSTISCSTTWPSATFGCFIERRVLTLGALELALGVDAQTVLSGTLADTHLAPYAILAAYLDTWSAWAEVRLPPLGGIPVLGSPDWLRIGFSYRFP